MSTMAAPETQAEPSGVPAWTRFTPEDLLTMSDGGRFELIDGELVERRLSAISGYVEGDELTGDDVVPGVRCPSAALFPTAIMATLSNSEPAKP